MGVWVGKWNWTGGRPSPPVVLQFCAQNATGEERWTATVFMKFGTISGRHPP